LKVVRVAPPGWWCRCPGTARTAAERLVPGDLAVPVWQPSVKAYNGVIDSLESRLLVTVPADA